MKLQPDLQPAYKPTFGTDQKASLPWVSSSDITRKPSTVTCGVKARGNGRYLGYGNGVIIGTVLGPVFFSTRSAGECCGPEGLVERSGVWAECWVVMRGGFTSPNVLVSLTHTPQQHILPPPPYRSSIVSSSSRAPSDSFERQHLRYPYSIHSLKGPSRHIYTRSLI
jgi:hypothetical protein